MTKALVLVNDEWWFFDGIKSPDGSFEVYIDDEIPWIEDCGREIKGEKMTQVMFG